MAIESLRGAAGIRAVILDYGEVLCHRPSEKEFGRLEEIFGAKGNSFQALWDKNRGAFDRGDMTAEAYWMALRKMPGRESMASGWRKCAGGILKCGEMRTSR